MHAYKDLETRSMNRTWRAFHVVRLGASADERFTSGWYRTGFQMPRVNRDFQSSSNQPNLRDRALARFLHAVSTPGSKTGAKALEAADTLEALEALARFLHAVSMPGSKTARTALEAEDTCQLTPKKLLLRARQRTCTTRRRAPPGPYAEFSSNRFKMLKQTC